MTTLSNPWVNPDGLAVKFGADEAVVGNVGSYEDTFGPMQVFETTLLFSDIVAATATPAYNILTYSSPIPKGSRIHEVKIITETVWTGTGCTIDLGFIQQDFTTVSSATALMAAFPITSMATAGQQTVLTAGSTYAGGYIGTTLAADGYLISDYNTAAPTAGKSLIQILYFLPSTTE